MKKMRKIDRKRRNLIDTAVDHFCGDELEWYVDRIVNSSDRTVQREWKRVFDKQEPWE